eukprot:3471190-Pleurochrysis_carterae.AAC.1
MPSPVLFRQRLDVRHELVERRKYVGDVQHVRSTIRFAQGYTLGVPATSPIFIAPPPPPLERAAHSGRPMPGEQPRAAGAS